MSRIFLQVRNNIFGNVAIIGMRLENKFRVDIDP